MKRKLYSRLLLASTLVFLIQCSPGSFKPDSSPTGSTDNSANGDGNDIVKVKDPVRQKQLEAAIQSATLTGMVSEGSSSNPNVPAISFDRKLGAFLLRVPMTAFTTLTGFNMTFPDYPGLQLYAEHIDEKPYITVLVPVKYVLRNVTEVPAKLPNGDRVPLFAAGEPPSRAILLTPNRSEKIYLYLSAEAFGIFAETKFNPLPSTGFININEFMFSIKSPDKLKTLGYLTFVAKKAPFNGGFFLSHTIDPKLGKILDEYYLN